MSGSEDVPDVTRLRAFAEMMCETGLTRLALSDGTVLERPPPTPFEQAMRAHGRPQAGTAAAADDDDEDEIADEEAMKKALERAWKDKWSRIGSASGSGIPAFPGVKLAQQFLGVNP